MGIVTMQVLHTRRIAPLQVVIVNVTFALGGILLFVAYFSGWLGGSRIGGAIFLLLGLGVLAEGIFKYAGWLPKAEQSKSLGVAWLVAYGIGMILGGIFMLLAY